MIILGASFLILSFYIFVISAIECAKNEYFIYNLLLAFSILFLIASGIIFKGAI